MLTVALPTCTTDELAIVLPTAAVPLTNICAVVIPTLAPTLIVLTKSTAPVIAAPPDDIVSLPPSADVVVIASVAALASPVMSTSAPAVMSPPTDAGPLVVVLANQPIHL